MLVKIKDILIIVNKGQLNQYKNYSHGKIRYQFKPKNKVAKGLHDAFIIGEKFINNQNVVLILGDNFFGGNIFKKLQECTKLNSGAKVLLRSCNPEKYGVAKKNKIFKLRKAKKISFRFSNNWSSFDKKVVKFAKQQNHQKKRLEITDLLNKYKNLKKLSADYIGRGGAWLDTGSLDDFYKTSNFVSAIENRQGFKIACLEEISLLNKWISKKQINEAIKFYGSCEYSAYLKKLI